MAVRGRGGFLVSVNLVRVSRDAGDPSSLGAARDLVHRAEQLRSALHVCRATVDAALEGAQVDDFPF